MISKVTSLLVVQLLISMLSSVTLRKEKNSEISLIHLDWCRSIRTITTSRIQWDYFQINGKCDKLLSKLKGIRMIVGRSPIDTREAVAFRRTTNVFIIWWKACHGSHAPTNTNSLENSIYRFDQSIVSAKPFRIKSLIRNFHFDCECSNKRRKQMLVWVYHMWAVGATRGDLWRCGETNVILSFFCEYVNASATNEFIMNLYHYFYAFITAGSSTVQDVAINVGEWWILSNS